MALYLLLYDFYIIIPSFSGYMRRFHFLTCSVTIIFPVSLYIQYS